MKSRQLSKIINKDILYDMYVTQHKSTLIIAKHFKCSRNNILYWLSKFGIQRRDSPKYGKDITGKTRWNLTAVKVVGQKSNGEKIWLCNCSCGNSTQISVVSFGKTKSCGCLLQHNGKSKGYNEISGSLWYKIKNQAQKRGLKFEITIEEAWNLYILQNRKCALSNLEIGFGNMDSRNISASLDRIDSSKGYVLNNVQWVHRKINFMKQNYTEKDFIYYCTLVVHHKCRTYV